MSRPAAFNNFPGAPAYRAAVAEFKDVGDIAQFEWTGNGFNEPSGQTDTSGGAIVLGGSGLQLDTPFTGDSLQGQRFSSTVQFNRLAKFYYWEWQVMLSSATLCNALLGACITNTNLMGAATTDGIGLYTFGGSWYPFNVAGGSFLPSSAPSVAALAVADALNHTWALQVTTDANTAGAGQATWFLDGNPVGAPQKFGALGLTQLLLRQSVAMSLGSAVTQSLTVALLSETDQA